MLSCRIITNYRWYPFVLCWCKMFGTEAGWSRPLTALGKLGGLLDNNFEYGVPSLSLHSPEFPRAFAIGPIRLGIQAVALLLAQSMFATTTDSARFCGDQPTSGLANGTNPLCLFECVLFFLWIVTETWQFMQVLVLYEVMKELKGVRVWRSEISYVSK
jgi:hypothetical protein